VLFTNAVHGEVWVTSRHLNLQYRVKFRCGAADYSEDQEDQTRCDAPFAKINAKVAMISYRAAVAKPSIIWSVGMQTRAVQYLVAAARAHQTWTTRRQLSIQTPNNGMQRTALRAAADAEVKRLN
jgi:hypothetical protein